MKSIKERLLIIFKFSGIKVPGAYAASLQEEN